MLVQFGCVDWFLHLSKDMVDVTDIHRLHFTYMYGHQYVKDLTRISCSLHMERKFNKQ